MTARRKALVKGELDLLKVQQYPNNTQAIESALACLEVCIGSGFNAPVCQTALGRLVENDSNELKREALRYLAYPPISKDDLESTAEIVSFTKKTIDAKANPKSPDEIPDRESAMRIMQIIGESLDGVRFPWLTDAKQFGSGVTKDKIAKARKFAIESTALMLSAQQTQTTRRSTEKDQLEGEVLAILTGCGFKEMPKKILPNVAELHASLKPGEFMKECNVANENADFVVRLLDGRFLFIECKASNSEVNSRKRLNKEAVKNIQVWKDQLGASIIGACSIRGIFKPEYVIGAQNQGLNIFWAHNLTALADFLKIAK